MSTDYQEKLPYPKPLHPQMAVIELSKVIGVPVNYKLINDEEYIKILSGIILYRRLNSIEKQDVMARIYRLDDRGLQSKLIGKILNVTVQPLWGMWSLSNKEIEEYLSLNKKVLDMFTVLGVNPGAVGVIQGTWDLIKTKGKGGGLMIAVSLIMLGLNQAISDETNALQAEKEKRTTPANPSAY
jgi:hypothetical protein